MLRCALRRDDINEDSEVGRLLISEVGRVLYDPSNHFYNSPPLSALCRTIEINLRERLGDREIPQPITTVDGILM